MTQKTISQILLDLRERNDLKQKDVANILGITQQTYSNYERGEREIPIYHLKTLAEFYQTSLDYMTNISINLPGNLNSTSEYIDGISVGDVVFEMGRLPRSRRRELIRYLNYLKQINP